MNTCSICRDSIINDGFTTQCNHHMHNSCLTHWLLINNTCPICRHNLCGHPNDNDNDDVDDVEEDDEDIIDIVLHFFNEIYTPNYNTILDSLKEIINRLSSENENEYMHYFNWCYDETNHLYYIKINTRTTIIYIYVNGIIYENVLHINISFNTIDKKYSDYYNKSITNNLYISNYSPNKLPIKINCY